MLRNGWMGQSFMKLLTEYLERAVHFERLAADEESPALRDQLHKQAKDYRRLAAKRAAELGLPPPSDPKP